MSTKPIRRISRRIIIAAAALAGVCLLVSGASAQEPNVSVRVLPDAGRVAIEVNRASASSWSFVDSYAGIVGLGRRIEHFAAIDETGNEVSVTQTAPGQFKSTNPARRIRYEVDLHPVSRAADFSHLSWLTKDRGILMPVDLLPVETEGSGRVESYRIHFQLMAPWTVHSTEKGVAPDVFTMTDIARAVFAVGANLRASETEISGLTLNFVTNSEWAFSDADVLQLGRQVLNAHRETFGLVPARTVTLVLFPFPLAVGSSQWSAETRGTTVALSMGKLPSKVAALAQLSTPLTHEFFHLWIPNALKWQGNYDWFYEGFTIYQASQTAVKLGLLTFPEFLNAIARAYDSSKGQRNLSVIEASNRRFTSELNSVYAKSQVVAFIYDLQLRSQSRNKRSLRDVYRELMTAVRGGGVGTKGFDGNANVTFALSEMIGSHDFVNSFIGEPISIDLATALEPFGLRAEANGARTQISVKEKLSKQQRDLLRDLGYNAATHAAR